MSGLETGMSWGRQTLAWTLRALAAAGLLAVSTVHAQQADVAAANKQALGDAMGRLLMPKVVERQFAPADVIGGTADINLNGFGEEFVYLVANPCGGIDCGLFLFVLVRDEYREVLGEVPGARISSPNTMIDRKRNGFLDIRFGTVEAGWDGNRYVDVATLPKSTLDTGAFMTMCLAEDDNDYTLQQAGADVNSSRQTLCQCQAQRYLDFNVSQESLDLYVRYRNSIDHQPEFSGPIFDAIVYMSGDINQGCLVENGWSTWGQALGVTDAQGLQNPLVFDAFLQTCSVQDWLIANRGIGTADRALGLCGCLGRKLAAKSFDQPMLDALTRFYGSEIGETELDEINNAVLPMNDSEANACLSEMPKRQP